ncbi:XdhC family protein [Thalassotalea psychrophila]|uniref:XdhC family protein n=1 Tax=Thalassotalea psychrophila TaxID=3065647 RepID=A0ABY9TZC0_9GAMM|nr:XdhC family protein [Colwelliaceae bacterium SQ149]
MQLTDINVITKAQQWLSENRTIWLCTILKTYGSAPRPIGSIFLTDGDERVGSISGGCLEDAFVNMIKQDKFLTPAELFTYGEHAVEQDIVRELPCGGTIRLLVEYFTPTKINHTAITHWLELAQTQQAFLREIFFTNKTSATKPLIDDSVQQVVETRESVQLAYAQVYSLLLVGIGQVTEHIAQLGLQAGFDVKVCDMRKELASSWHFTKANGGVDIHWQSPDQFIERYANKRSAVLALAHDPRVDDVAMMSVFDTPAFYIGAMGSIRTTDKRHERLKRICSLSDAQLTRLIAPIGLNIGSKTPFEIAISTMADIIRVRHGINKELL